MAADVTVTVGADTSELEREAQNAARALGDVSDAVEDVGKAGRRAAPGVKRVDDAMTDAAAGAEDLADKAREAADDLDELADKADEAAEDVEGLGEEAGFTSVELERMRAAADRAGDETKRAGDKAQRAGRDFDSFADEAEKANRISMILGGTLGDVTGGLDDFAVLMRSGITRTTALAGASIVGVAAIAGLSAGFVETVQNIDEYAESLDALDRQQMAPSIRRIKEARNELDDLGDAFVRLRVAASATAAPVFEDFTRGLAFVIDKAADALTPSTYVDQIRSDPSFQEYQQFLDEQARQYEAVKEDKDAAAAAADDNAAAMANEAAAIEAVTTAAHAMGAALSSARQAADEAIDSGREVGASLGSISADVVQGGWTAETFTDPLVAGEEAAESLRVEMRENLNQSTSDLVGIAGAVSGSLTNTLQSFSDFTDAQLATGAISAREAFDRQKGIAIANATIQGAMAALSAFSGSVQTIPGPAGLIVGGVAAAAAAGVAATQIGIIASSEPMHQGGLSLGPDEYVSSTDGIVRRDNEMTGTFTRQSLDALGGPQALQDMLRGNMPGQSAPGGPAIYVVNGEQVTRGRLFAAPTPRAGHG